MTFNRNLFFSRTLKTVLWIVSLIFGSLFVGLSVLIVVLLSEPMDLKNHHAYGQYALQSIFPNARLKFKEATLEWDKETWSFVLRAHHVRIKSMETFTKFKFPEVSAFLPAYRIFILNFHPKTLQFKNARIRLHHFKNQNTPKDHKEGELDSDDDFLKILQELVQTSPIDKILISNAKVLINIEPYGKWKFKKANLAFQNREGTIESTFSVKLKTMGSLSGKLFTKQNASHKLQLSLENLNLQNFITHPNLENISFFKNLPTTLSDLSLPLSGTLGIDLNSDFTVQKVGFQFQCGKGTLSYAPFFPTPVSLNSASLEGHFQNNIFHLKSFSLDSPHTKAHLGGEITVAPSLGNPQTLHFNLQGKARNLSFEDAKLLWPEDLASVTRQWIINHIPQGQIPLSTLEFQGAYDFEKKALNLQTLKGTFNPEKSTLFYLEGLPSVKDVKAEATFDKDTLSVNLLEGATFDQKITGGKITISGLQKEDQWIDINLNVKGSARDALKIIDVPRLRYAKKYGLSPQKTDGVCHSTVKFAFPLERSTTLDEVDFTVESQINECTIKDVINFFPMTLTKGTLQIKVTKAGMVINGKALLNHAPSQIHWQESFNPKSSWRSKLSVTGTLSKKQFNQMAFFGKDTFYGKAPFTVNFLKTSSEKGTLTATLNLDKVFLKIPPFRIEKPSGTKGTISLQMKMTGSHPESLQSLKINAGKTLQFEAQGTFYKNSARLKEFKTLQFKTSQDTYSATLRQNSNKIHEFFLIGSFIALDAFMDKKDTLEDSFLSTTPYHAHLSFKKVDINGKPLLETMNVDIDHSAKGILNKIHLNGFLPSSQGKKETCKVLLSTQGDQQILSIQLDNLAQPLSALTTTTDLRGGKTEINAKRKIAVPQAPWEGSYKIKNFEIIKAPVLARLLKIVSPLSLFELFSKGKGLKFSQLKGGFILEPETLILKKSHGTGPSIGMTLEGSINRTQETLDLRGTLIPAYILNSMLSAIPLIGPLLSGGSSQEGVFAVSFTITGSQSDPKIQSNPLSALTPGILRKMFEGNPKK